jgi:hypothetical protein
VFLVPGERVLVKIGSLLRGFNNVRARGNIEVVAALKKAYQFSDHAMTTRSVGVVADSVVRVITPFRLVLKSSDHGCCCRTEPSACCSFAFSKFICFEE